MNYVTEERFEERMDELVRMIAEGFSEIHRDFARKEDLQDFLRKEDLQDFARKEDLERFATKEDLLNMETRLESKMDSYLAIERADYTSLSARTTRLENAIFHSKPA